LCCELLTEDTNWLRW